MKIFIIAGEASGDQHAADLAGELHLQSPEIVMEGWGGDRMETAKVKIHKHIRELAFMGFTEVLLNLPQILRNFKVVKKQIIEFRPDALILVDYPGFNLRIAKWASAQNIPVYYYIAPQVWAWKPGRYKTIRDHVKKLFVILPFEQAWFKQRNVDAIYTGHPLLKHIPEQPDRQLPANPVIALLPGSRKQEISKILPAMLSILPDFPDCRFVIAGAPAIPINYYEQFLPAEHAAQLSIISNQTYEILKISDAAMVASGTATLETALWNVPQIVCYKGGSISFWLARQLVKVPYIALVNLLLNKPALPELIQNNLNRQQLKAHLNAVLNGELRNMQLNDYQNLRNSLMPENAARTIASFILQKH